jgi:hypothetical protein
MEQSRRQLWVAALDAIGGSDLFPEPLFKSTESKEIVYSGIAMSSKQ